MQTTCCSLNCRLIPFCSKYNNGVDRGEKCAVREEIEYRIGLMRKEEAKKARNSSAKRKDDDKVADKSITHD